MKEILRALRALERLGAEWRVQRLSKRFLRDTIEGTTLVQTHEGVIRGFVEMQRGDTWRVRMEVFCYLDGRLKSDGTFKHLKHPERKTAKIFEYKSVVMLEYSKGLFGIGRGFRPSASVPDEHQFLADFADQLIAEVDSNRDTVEEREGISAENRRLKNQELANRALFG